MPLFRCLIRGENFPVLVEGRRTLFGFYTTRFVETTSAQDAELVALGLLRADPSLQPASGVPRNPDSRVYFEEIVEVTFEGEQLPNSGFTWYEMGT
jgi:hypothetical protein